METIICGVDGSSSAREALRIAVDLGDKFGFRIVAVHVVKWAAADRGHDGGVATLRARGRAERLLANVLDEEGLVGEVDWRAEVGERAERLAAVAQEERAALIVLGSGSPKWGSSTRSRLAPEIAKLTPVPVAVPAERRIIAGGRGPAGQEGQGAGRNGCLGAVESGDGTSAHHDSSLESQEEAA